MRCKEILSGKVHWVPDGCSVSQAAKLMVMHRVELLPICGADAHLLGVITARDVLVRVVAKGRVPELTRVDEVMTSPAEFVPPDCPVERAAELMSREGVSQLVVLNDDGRLEGIIGLNDLLMHAPEACPVETIRGILMWRSAEPTAHGASNAPVPSTADEGPSPSVATVVNPARAEAEIVVRGGTNDLKEFPG